MPYFVSRQRYWPAGTPVVEVAMGGLDYANPDMLCETYRHLGEGKEYTDPREAVEAAIMVCKAWRKDGGRSAKVAYGSTGGFTLPFEPSTFRQAREWADKLYGRAAKCDHCGDMLGNGRHDRWTLAFPYDDDGAYCSENCADHGYEALCKLNAEEE